MLGSAASCHSLLDALLDTRRRSVRIADRLHEKTKTTKEIRNKFEKKKKEKTLSMASYQQVLSGIDTGLLGGCDNLPCPPTCDIVSIYTYHTTFRNLDMHQADVRNERIHMMRVRHDMAGINGSNSHFKTEKLKRER